MKSTFLGKLPKQKERRHPLSWTTECQKWCVQETTKGFPVTDTWRTLKKIHTFAYFCVALGNFSFSNHKQISTAIWAASFTLIAQLQGDISWIFNTEFLFVSKQGLYGTSSSNVNQVKIFACYGFDDTWQQNTCRFGWTSSRIMFESCSGWKYSKRKFKSPLWRRPASAGTIGRIMFSRRFWVF